MSHNLKFLFVTALSSAVLISCSNEAALIDPKVVTSESATQAAEMAAEKAAMLEKQAQDAKEMALKDQAMAKRKAEAASAAAEAEAKMIADKKAAKEAMARAEAQAREAKNAAEAKVAKEAMARAEDQRRRVEAQRVEAARVEAQRLKAEQAALETQRIQAAEAQRAKDAQMARDAQAAEQAAIQQAQAPAEPIAPVSANPNAPYNAFLSKYVSGVNGINLVAYDKVTPQDRAVLRRYIEKLSAMNIEALPRDAEMATWFNLYNAKTIELILENYPTKSIRKISNPWKKDRLVVNGRKMSLDDIEHGTVRKKYNEPRVHYAFNCASIGCPNVKRTAWEASTLEADLVQASRDFVASERGVAVRDGKIIASSIFKWYKKDFGDNEAGVLAHLRQYASGPKKAALDAANKINKYDYDWDLNIR